jgi:hypothetical protein
MEWAQILTLAGINVALIAAMTTMVVWTATKHDAEIKSIANRLDGHAGRIDQLYQMFVDLIKEGKKQ